MRKYTREEVFQETLQYFNGDTLAANVWIDKYALKDYEGNIYELTPNDMHRRLAKEFARIESKYPKPINEESIYELLKDFKYLVPQGSPMAGIGNNFVITSLSNCFVIAPAIDSYGGIMHNDQEQVQLMKRRGGVGHDLSNLRPVDSLANGSKLKGDTGMTLYMSRYSNSTREVAQDGRRGALMLSTHIKHPDSERFIDMKLDTTKVTGANVSVKIDDEFMYSVKSNSSYIQTFPIDSTNPKVNKVINSKDLWSKIVYNAWKSAEPGILFWDTIARECPTAGYGKDWKPSSTNPCGEIPLCPYDSCRLLAINLYSYVEFPFTEKSRFNWVLFKEHTRIAQRLMDDIVDLEIEKLNNIITKIESDPEPEHIKSVELELWKKIRAKAIEGRRTGLGVTAEGDMLAALGFIYGTESATNFAIEVHKQLSIEAYTSSIILAEERGCFPIWNFNKDLQSNFLCRVYDELSPEHYNNLKVVGRRNIALLTIAPTGTTSLMTQTTSGIEPVFMPVYKRRRKTEDKSKSVFIDSNGDMWEEYNVFHHKFIEWFKNWNECNLSYEEALNTLDLKDNQTISIITEKSPYHKATSNDVNYLEKVRMQGEIQKWVDHSISVTVNMPETTTVEMVEDVYMTAWKEGCKGITIYRDKSRDGVLVSNISTEGEIVYTDSPKRPKTLRVDIYTKKALGKDWTILVGLLKDKPYEIFAFDQLSNKEFPKDIKSGTLSKIGKQHYTLKGVKDGEEFVIDNILKYMTGDEQFQTRDFSRSLRHGEHPKYIIDDIDKSSLVTSFRKVVSRVLKNYLTNEDAAGNCPNCGQELRYESGCKTCVNPECGWSACG